MDDTGRQTGARRGPRRRRDGGPRPGRFPVDRPQPASTPEGAEGFEQGWFGANPPPAAPHPPVSPPARAGRPPETRRVNPETRRVSSAHLPPVPRPAPRPGPPAGPPPGPRPAPQSAPQPAPRPAPESDFDRERFADALTDPDPFRPIAAEPVVDEPESTPEPEWDDRHPADHDAEPDREEPADRTATDRTAAERPATGRPATERTAGRKSGKKARRKLPFWLELPILIVAALLFTFLIQTFVARVYVIPSGSMELTLNGNNGSGDRILVDKVVYDFHGPRPGDVIVFKGPPGWDQTEFFPNTTSNPVVGWLRSLAASVGIAKPNEYDLVKRVIAVGGQTVSCCDSQNRVMVDGRPLDEPYIHWQPGRPGPDDQPRFEVTVPKGYLWVMGDNRNNSDDSRYQDGGGIHGVVPVSDVIGKARTIIWPPSRWRGIGDHDPQAGGPVALPASGWGSGLPATGIGALAALPTLWLGRRHGRAFRAAAGLPRRRRD